MRKCFAEDSVKRAFRSISLSTGRRNSIFIPRKLLFGGRPSFLWKLLPKGRGAGMKTWTKIIFSKHVKNEGLGLMTGSEEMWLRGSGSYSPSSWPKRTSYLCPTQNAVAPLSSEPTTADENSLRMGPGALHRRLNEPVTGLQGAYMETFYTVSLIHKKLPL